MAKFRLSGPAEHDLDEIWLYIARDDPNAADRLINAVVEAMALLAENPKMGRARNELGPSLRGIPVGNYLIIYRPMENGVEVVRVMHGARNIQALFDDER